MTNTRISHASSDDAPDRNFFRFIGGPLDGELRRVDNPPYRLEAMERPELDFRNMVDGPAAAMKPISFKVGVYILTRFDKPHDGRAEAIAYVEEGLERGNLWKRLLEGYRPTIAGESPEWSRKPTCGGFYWLRFPDRKLEKMVWVFTDRLCSGELRVEILGSGSVYYLAEMPHDSLWSGPIVPPKH